MSTTFASPVAQSLSFCPSCGNAAKTGAAFCTKCGTAIPAPVTQDLTCANGHPINAGASFCADCGVPRSGQNPPPIVQVPRSAVPVRTRRSAKTTATQISPITAAIVATVLVGATSAFAIPQIFNRTAALSEEFLQGTWVCGLRDDSSSYRVVQFRPDGNTSYSVRWRNRDGSSQNWFGGSDGWRLSDQRGSHGERYLETYVLDGWNAGDFSRFDVEVVDNDTISKTPIISPESELSYLVGHENVELLFEMAGPEVCTRSTDVE